MTLFGLVFVIAFFVFFCWFLGTWLVGSNLKEFISFLVKGIKGLRCGKWGGTERTVFFILYFHFFLFSIFIAVLIRDLFSK